MSVTPAQVRRIVAEGGSGPTIIRKTADETVNNSSTLQDDDELFLPVAENEIWLAQWFLLLNAASDTPDYKFGMSGPTGATMRWGVGSTQSTSGVAFSWFSTATGSPLGLAAISDTLTTGGTTVVSGIFLPAIIVVGGTAGDVKLRWAQNTPTAVNTKVLTNSCLIAHQLA